jgi:hypothetical protein
MTDPCHAYLTGRPVTHLLLEGTRTQASNAPTRANLRHAGAEHLPADSLDGTTVRCSAN